MIANFSDYPSSGLGDIDICVIGGGAAGITIAKHLDGSGIRVLLLEGGEMEASEPSQKIYEGISDGYASLTATRLRFFGGTTN
ncbi:FAD-dependent oxidoreductase, partial [Microvirga massiliensis]|uniref:FAD-dependent oxidoreductase n=1 Tax=Microvirga massiliensis TaxID=1033741 RepID=UPI00062BBDA9